MPPPAPSASTADAFDLDALVPAFVAALLAGVGDRPARLAAMLGARGPVIAGLVVGHALAIALSVAGSYVIAPLLAPNARALVLAIALLLAGVGGLLPRKVTDVSGSAFLAAAAGSFVTGDATAFLAFALAVAGSVPVLAGVGALAGALLLAITAASLGSAWERLPLVALGRVAGVLLLVVGGIVALGALRLI